MALSNIQQQQIEANIKKLDYLEGTGVLSTNKKNLVKEVFVFISVGGTGWRALCNLKKTIMNQVERMDVNNQIMFLAIDADHAELQERIDRDELDIKEVLKIPFEGAHDSIEPNRISPALKAWVHPNLWNITGGSNRVSDEFSGTGAGARRQCGRVLFSQQVVQDEFRTRLMKIQSLLNNQNEISKIKIFFLAGLSGGTGSGCIIDVAFLTRHFLKTDIISQLYNSGKVVFSGYLFLPSACGITNAAMERENGDINAYAALKEIDYYMTITNRNERFVMDYGTSNTRMVEIGDDIFNFCTLVEGVPDGGGRFLSPEETHQIVADSIMNIICANNAATLSRKDIFLVDSFLSNRSEKVDTQIRNQSDRVWPRDTNYIYNVIGISSCVVPVDLLTVYVTKKIFDKVFDNFRLASLVDEDAAESFLECCGLDFRSLKRNRNFSLEQIKKDIQAQADIDFQAYGPYYMVNLTKMAMDLINNSPDDYLHKAVKKQNDFFGAKDNLRRIENIYKVATEYLLEMNNRLYEVYSYVIKVLKDLIEKNAKILTDTQEYKAQFGSSFCWSPIDLTPGEQATDAVMKYLDGILSEEEIKQKAERFMEMLCEKKEEWTQLEPPEGQGVANFDAAKTIREFISENIDQVTAITLEDFIVKAYSGKKEAKPAAQDPVTKQARYSDETKLAAETIMSELSNKARVLASTGNGFSLLNCYSNIYLTIPQNCPNLKNAILDVASNYGLNASNIYESSAQDRLVFCNLYTGVPIWALVWTPTAEAAYERDYNKAALHLEQGENKKNGADLPNLYPEKLWRMNESQVLERKGHEGEISHEIRINMKIAENLSMLRKTADPYYTIYLLNTESDAETLMEKADLIRGKKYEFSEVLDILVEKEELVSFEINFTNMVMVDSSLGEMEQEAFKFELACRAIRLFRDKYKLLNNTVAVIQELQRLNAKRPDIQMITKFISALKWELLGYNSERKLWYNRANDEMAIGMKLEDKFEQICAHYYGFQAFSSMDESDREWMMEEISAIEDNAKRDELSQAQKRMSSLKNSIKMLREAKSTDTNPWTDDSPFKVGNGSPWPMATDKFMKRAESEIRARDIRAFYTDLIDNM